MRDVERDRLKQLIETGMDVDAISKVMQEEYGLTISKQEVDYWKGILDLKGQKWYQNSEKISKCEEDMLDLMSEGYSKLLDWQRQLQVQKMGAKDATALLQGIREASRIYNKIVVPARKELQMKKLKKEILEDVE